MRSILVKGLAGGGLLFLTLALNAQDYGRYRDNDRYYDRDDRGYPRGGGSVIERVESDLSYAASSAYSRGERNRVEKARHELGEFERAWNSGRFNRHDLDDSIAAIQRVVDHNRLDERARSVLWSDVQRLRDFRADYERRGYPRY